MSLVIVETTTDQPLPANYLRIAQQFLPCFAARNIIWNYSCLAADRQRMICSFDAPDAGTVRDVYRQAGLPPRPIWASNLVEPDAQPQQPLTTLQIVEGSYSPLSEEEWHTFSQKIADGCEKDGIEWIRLYSSLDRTKVIGELNAPDAETVQQALTKVGVSFDRIWSAQVLSPST